MACVAGDERSGFGAEAVVAEGDGDKARAERKVDFLRRKVSFGPDKQSHVAAGTIIFCQQTALDAVVAIGDKTLRVVDRRNKIFYRRHFVDLRQNGFQRLLHGRDGDFFEAVGLDFLALGTVAAQGHNAVDTDLDKLLDKPLHAVVVLCRGDSHSDAVGPYLRQRDSLDNLDAGALGMGHGEAAAVEIAAAVNNLEHVAGLHAQDSHGMLRIALGERRGCQYVRSIEPYHFEAGSGVCLYLNNRAKSTRTTAA